MPNKIIAPATKETSSNLNPKRREAQEKNMTALNQQTTKLLYRLTDVKHRVGVSSSSIWAWVKQGKFPKPHKISDNVTAWSAADVDRWVAERIAASQQK